MEARNSSSELLRILLGSGSREGVDHSGGVRRKPGAVQLPHIDKPGSGPRRWRRESVVHRRISGGGHAQDDTGMLEKRPSDPVVLVAGGGEGGFLPPQRHSEEKEREGAGDAAAQLA